MRKLELGEACHSCFDIFFDLYLLLVGVNHKSSTTGSACYLILFVCWGLCASLHLMEFKCQITAHRCGEGAR